MAQNLEIGLTAQELGGLDRLVPGPLSAVSPLGRGAPLSASDYAALGARGWFDAAGKLAPVLFQSLQALATARASCQVTLVVGDRVSEHVVAFAADGSHSIACSSTPSGLVLRDPAPVDAVLASIGEYIGASVIRAVPFEADLDVASGLVLAGVLDIQRRARLRALAEGTGAPPVVIDPRLLPQSIHGTPAGSQWLVALLTTALGGALPLLDEGTVSRSLFLLEKQGLVASGPHGVAVAGSAFALANRLLTFDSLVAVRAARLGESGEVQATSFQSLHSGVHDVLLVDVTGGAVRFCATAAAAVLEMLRLFLTEPDALRPATSPAPRPRDGMRTTVL